MVIDWWPGVKVTIRYWPGTRLEHFIDEVLMSKTPDKVPGVNISFPSGFRKRKTKHRKCFCCFFFDENDSIIEVKLKAGSQSKSKFVSKCVSKCVNQGRSWRRASKKGGTSIHWKKNKKQIVKDMKVTRLGSCPIMMVVLSSDSEPLVVFNNSGRKFRGIALPGKATAALKQMVPCHATTSGFL